MVSPLILTYKMEKLKLFITRKIKAKEIFSIMELPKQEALTFIAKFHYLKDAKFFAKYCYGLYCGEQLVGVATYSNPQGVSTLKGWFSLNNTDQSVLELSRLCVLPELNGSNATSYLLGNSLRRLKTYGVKAVITLADSQRHVGSIYQICNFTYYGLTNAKTDFFRWDGAVNPRGETATIKGVWLPRTKKHRYCFFLDKKLVCNYPSIEYPKIGTTKIECCNGEKRVFDKRFNEWHNCPKCTE